MTLAEQLTQLAKRLSSPEGLAEAFCDMDDDAQAQFFVNVAAIASTWPRNQFGAVAAEFQALEIGSHLRTCVCASEGARDFIRNIHAGMVKP